MRLPFLATLLALAVFDTRLAAAAPEAAPGEHAAPAQAANERKPATAVELTLIAISGEKRTLTLEQLAAMPQEEVSHPPSGEPEVVMRGPSLRSLLTIAGAPEGTMLRGMNMSIGVLAEGSDGTLVAFTLAELDEQFGARKAIVAITQDGGPIPPEDGPLRVAVAGDRFRARWARHVVRLRLVRVGS